MVIERWKSMRLSKCALFKFACHGNFSDLKQNKIHFLTDSYRVINVKSYLVCIFTHIHVCFLLNNVGHIKNKFSIFKM